MTDNNPNAPSLSNYFANDPHSLFDEIGEKNDSKYRKITKILNKTI